MPEQISFIGRCWGRAEGGSFGSLDFTAAPRRVTVCTAPQQDNKSLLSVISAVKSEKSGSDQGCIQMFDFQ